MSPPLCNRIVTALEEFLKRVRFNVLRETQRTSMAELVDADVSTRKGKTAVL